MIDSDMIYMGRRRTHIYAAPEYIQACSSIFLKPISSTIIIVYQKKKKTYNFTPNIFSICHFSEGRLTKMSDVYNFGVVLLEIMSGKRALDNDRSYREYSLVDWAK